MSSHALFTSFENAAIKTSFCANKITHNNFGNNIFGQRHTKDNFCDVGSLTL